MRLDMYAIKDKLSGFASPIPFTNEEMAKRYFKTQLIENPIMRNSQEDFNMYYVGGYETKTGEFTTNIQKIM